MPIVRRFLNQPLTHLVLGIVFALIFCWPMFASDSAWGTWVQLYGSWTLCVGLIALIAFSSKVEEA